MVVTFATRCLNCHACVDLPVWMVTLRTFEGQTRWSYKCPLCSGWCSRDANAAQMAAFTTAGIVPQQVAPPISEADVERFAAEMAAMPSAVR